jgi:hypothetical protein
MNTMLEWPRPTLGPTMKNRLGKWGTVVPLYAAIPESRHWSARDSPCLPTTRSAIGSSVV